MTLVAAMMTFVGASAQNSFDTALPLAEGLNSSEAYSLGYDNGAYFKYTATETTILSAKSTDGEYIDFYNGAQESDYNYASVADENYIYTYYIKVPAGETYYIKVTTRYGSTANTVSFTAGMEYNAIGEGASESAPWNVVLGKNYWFEGGHAYMKYTATDDGVLVINQPSYCYGADYTTSSNSTPTSLSWSSSTRSIELPVVAGETYNIHTSASSYGIFNVTVAFTQPQQGDTQANPFILTLGDNTLPAAAQTYWYKFTNTGDKGFLTVKATGTMMAARTVGYDYNDITDNEQDMMTILLDMDQEILILVNKTTATTDAETLTAAFAAPQKGDIESDPIVLTSSETTPVASRAAKVVYYSIKNESTDAKFLNVCIDTEGINSMSASNVKLYKQGEDYRWYGTQLISKTTQSALIESGKTYMLRVDNKTTEPINFRAWMADIVDGDVFDKPLTAQLGNNTVPAQGSSTKFYNYTATKDCKLTVSVPTDATSISFPNDADGWNSQSTIAQTATSATIAATAGTKYTIRLNNIAAGSVFTIAEEDYAPGESRSTAIPFDGTYTFDDLNPYKLWLVWTAPATGDALINAELNNPSYADYIYYAVNNAYPTSIRHYDYATWDYIYDATAAVNEGDKVYFQLDVTSYQEGSTLTIKMDGTTGINALNAGSINSNRTYNLSGQQVGSDFRGIVIRDGKKQVVK